MSNHDKDDGIKIAVKFYKFLISFHFMNETKPAEEITSAHPSNGLLNAHNTDQQWNHDGNIYKSQNLSK